MMIRASGRSALIVATGLFVCFAAPSRAATGADGAAASAKSASSTETPRKYARHASRHWKRVAYRRSGKIALKSRKPADLGDDENANSSTLPPAVANANAQLASADMPAGKATAMTARANSILQAAPDNPPAENQVVPADQLNDLDRALHESKAPSMAMASADIPAAAVMARSDDSSAWDQTSLIGKIFIAFGALLTMASAARMFMA